MKGKEILSRHGIRKKVSVGRGRIGKKINKKIFRYDFTYFF